MQEFYFFWWQHTIYSIFFFFFCLKASASYSSRLWQDQHTKWAKQHPVLPAADINMLEQSGLYFNTVECRLGSGLQSALLHTFTPLTAEKCLCWRGSVNPQFRRIFFFPKPAIIVEVLQYFESNSYRRTTSTKISPMKFILHVKEVYLDKYMHKMLYVCIIMEAISRSCRETKEMMRKQLEISKYN